MYQIVVAIQYLGIILLVVELFYTFQQKNSKAQVVFVVISMATIVNLVGYLCEMSASNPETALMAVKVIYFGKPYIVFGTFLLVMEYCGIKLPKQLIWVLAAIHISVTALVFTCQYQKLFYNSIDYTQEGLFPHLILGHGPVYLFYTTLVILYLIIMIVACMVQYRKTTIEVEKKRILCMCGVAAVSVFAFVLFLTGVTQGYDTTAPAYVFSATIMFFALLKYNLLDGLVVAKDAIVDEFYDGIIVVDTAGKILYMNEQAVRIYPELKFIKDRRIIQYLEELYKVQKKLYLDERIYEIQKKVISQDAIFYGNVFIISDITDSYYDTVNLEKQKNIAEKANRAKSEFLARMSHEIRTPINAVLGMDEMILRESSEDNIRRYALDVKTAANTLLELINDILDTSKIEAGKMEVVPVEYQLDSLLRDLVNMISIRAKRKGLKLIVNVEKTIQNELYGDGTKIQQILLNLLTNAVKYTKEGVVTFSVRSVRKEEQVQLYFEVKDTGVGIKEDEISQIFAPFERLGIKENQNIEGTGLGMSITKQFLDMLGSQLMISSTYGEGSVFGFEVMQEVRSEEEIGDFVERVEEMARQYEYHATFLAPEAKILVVDDNEINRKVFISLLKKTKIQIVDVASGQECLERIQKERFDLIFMDHMMPIMDGIETFQQMKEMEHSLCKGVPVIILTANAIVGAKEQYLKEGFSDYLSKPVDIDKLEEFIKRYLPNEKWVENTEVTEKSLSFEELPELDEFDWEYAKEHLKDVEVLVKTIQIFYDSIDPEIEKLIELVKNLEDEENLNEYRIRVHALKSSSAVVGALLLSKLARVLEMAAKEKNMERIQLLNPILIEELQKHKERMTVLLKEKRVPKKRILQNKKEVLSIFRKLKKALEKFDYDVADICMEQLQNIAFSEIMDGRVQLLHEQVQNIETKNAIQTVDEIIEKMQQGEFE